MRTFKSKAFVRFARKSQIQDTQLLKAAHDASLGLIDADLGGGVIKMRLARTNAGKSGGFRTILFFRAAHRAFFIHGFAKKDQGNISDAELQDFKLLAPVLLDATDAQIVRLLNAGKFIEINDDAESENLQE